MREKYIIRLRNVTVKILFSPPQLTERGKETDQHNTTSHRKIKADIITLYRKIKADIVTLYVTFKLNSENFTPPQTCLLLKEEIYRVPPWA
jgi:hypothetical protein